MKNKALQTIKKYNMLTFEDSVVVGLSGGADSCALLHFLCSLCKEMHLSVYACHLNHLIRGAEAERDEQFVREVCDKQGVRLFVRRLPIEQMAKERKIGSEQCGREERYRFFDEIAQKYHAKIATAHTASDNAETLLLHLTRGCGIQGLCGIPPVRGNIIRPLIEVSREEVETYCSENHLSYMTDSTNLTRQYSRNQVRLDVLPHLKQINPSVLDAFQRLTIIMQDVAAHLDGQAKQLLQTAAVPYGYRTDILLKADYAVRTRAIELFCRRYVPNGIEMRHIEKIAQYLQSGGAVELNKRVRIVVKQGILRAELLEKSPPTVNEIPLQIGRTVMIGYKNITLSVLNMAEFDKQKKINKLLFNNALDYDKIPCTRALRTRRSGDTFVTPWGGQTKTLKKLMCELKIPNEQRDSIPVLAAENQVLWIDGVGVSKLYGVTKDTKNILVIQSEKPE